MSNSIDLTLARAKQAHPLGDCFSGSNSRGESIGFTNYYMMKDGKPFFGVTGELHFSRLRPEDWEDAILKAKAGGVNILSTYVFWIVHEELRGRFRFDGHRDLRRFVELCQAHGMLVILRLGPFGHGEMRNGAMPDWLYGMPFEVRNNSEGYFFYVRRLFREIHRQVEGLYFRQGGPIVAAQIENEYMHSSSGWEITGATSKEWLPGGRDGNDHMLRLKRIAEEEGIVTPFYTCTAWGGAATPTEEMLPLWGGYAYWPWHFHDGPGVHPVTPEYIYRDNHNNAVPSTYNFEPRYQPEDFPYACCEMMGGMACSYTYRFLLPYESIDAMANIKLGSGCNLLGYYMYRGGTTPTGERTPYLNEGYMPKRSYDFQAPLGETGLARPSYYRLKLLHLFCQQFAGELSRYGTWLPDYMEGLSPEDTTQLRFAVRTDGEQGFLFLNNFQDHLELPPVRGAQIHLKLARETLTVAPIDLDSGENAILPFNLDLGGVKLRYAAAQPICSLEAEGRRCWFFLIPAGMRPDFALVSRDGLSVSGCETRMIGDLVHCLPVRDRISHFDLDTDRAKLRIILLPRQEALGLTVAEGRAFLSRGTLIAGKDRIRLESTAETEQLLVWPARLPEGLGEPVREDLFTGFRFQRPAPTVLPAEKVAPGRWVIPVSTEDFSKHKYALLRLRYAGDIGNLFLDGELIADDYCNGSDWLVRLDPWKDGLDQQPLVLYVSPIRKGARVHVDSPMAARFETAQTVISELGSAELIFTDELSLDL